MSTRGRRTALQLLLGGVLALALLAGSAAGASAFTLSTTSNVTLTMSDGTPINAWVTQPLFPGSGKYPVVIMPSAWAGDSAEEMVPARALANDGYVVVEYAARGFGSSGGQYDLAGPQSVGDVSTIINWALAHTPADPNRIATAGVSYGAGIALLAAAFDPRIKAVGSLSGWADLADAFYPNQTRSSEVISVLQSSGASGGHPSTETTQMFSDFFADTNIPGLLDYVHSRSPLTYLSIYNQRKLPIFMESGFNETVFPIDQEVSFFNQLTGPKRLLLSAGDHASNDAVLAVFGFPSQPWDDMHAFLNSVLKSANPASAGQSVSIIPRSPGGPKPEETYSSFGQMTTASQTLALGPTGVNGAAGPITSSPSAAWSDTLTPGSNLSVPSGGIPLVTYQIEAITGTPLVATVGSIDPTHTAVWEGPSLANGLRIRGAVDVHVNVTPSASKGTVIAYLYDVNPLGVGYAIQHEPYTWIGAMPGSSIPIDMTMPPNAFDVPPGDRLMVAVSTWDSLYSADANPAGSTITLGASAGAPATVTVPYR